MVRTIAAAQHIPARRKRLASAKCAAYGPGLALLPSIGEAVAYLRSETPCALSVCHECDLGSEPALSLRLSVF
ncbi:hypothetical protein GCM10009863_23920 [Streptomyces axinellae]|uniref:Uncharacterized protein n=1 Tax=Streptomyces axinellae TaxID=552788 RepID=A0ABP6CAL5_9ACTN